jgi:ketosteroid isomerase-like protein
MNEIVAIDFANQAFYRAFAAVDLDAMANVWALAAPVSCSHPGAAPIFGRDAVLASWRGIFAAATRFAIDHRPIHVDMVGGIGVAHTIEILEGGTLLATNLFIKEGRIWRMIHHHAGPASFDPKLILPPAGEPLN